MSQIKNTDLYLERMSKPLQEKLKVTKYFPDNAKTLLDVGCADGTLTIAMAKLFPEIQFTGIDINPEFIELAKKNAGELKNVTFECRYLREKLADPQRYDVVTFCSVLHEFFTYGEGISTVVKALSDAHEILHYEGTLVIRDMILYNYEYSSDLRLSEIKKKITSNKGVLRRFQDFERFYGAAESIASLNHFLLKYMYTENWERELKENYTPVSFEKYDQIFSLLGMTVLFQRSSTISYLKEKWVKDFDFTVDELEGFRSTGIIAARKKTLHNIQ